jgi:hypothetical protein
MKKDIIKIILITFAFHSLCLSSCNCDDKTLLINKSVENTLKRSSEVLTEINNVKIRILIYRLECFEANKDSVFEKYRSQLKEVKQCVQQEEEYINSIKSNLSDNTEKKQVDYNEFIYQYKNYCKKMSDLIDTGNAEGVRCKIILNKIIKDMESSYQDLIINNKQIELNNIFIYKSIIDYNIIQYQAIGFIFNQAKFNDEWLFVPTK